VPITKEALRNIKQETGATAFFETGLLGGETFGHACRLGFEKVCSIEIKKEFTDRAILTYQAWIRTGVATVILDDSTNLADYLDLIGDHKCIFWLDAHLDSGLETAIKRPLTSCPLRKELEGIKSAARNDHVILVDDLRILTDHRFSQRTGLQYGPWQNDKLGLTCEMFSLEKIKKLILEINKDYQFETMDGYLLPFHGEDDRILRDDILMARVPG